MFVFVHAKGISIMIFSPVYFFCGHTLNFTCLKHIVSIFEIPVVIRLSRTFSFVCESHSIWIQYHAVF